MNNKILTLVLVLTVAVLSPAFKNAEGSTYVPEFSGTIDEIKKSLADNSLVGFTIESNSASNTDFLKKSEVYSKMFTMGESLGYGVNNYTVKFNDGFKNMKYLLRLFMATGITEVNFGKSVMSTEKFFAQFE